MKKLSKQNLKNAVKSNGEKIELVDESEYLVCEWNLTKCIRQRNESSFALDIFNIDSWDYQIMIDTHI